MIISFDSKFPEGGLCQTHAIFPSLIFKKIYSLGDFNVHGLGAPTLLAVVKCDCQACCHLMWLKISHTQSQVPHL